MTIATRVPKSWSIPKFDIKDSSLVLYLPLWYPYSDMADPTTIYSYDTNRWSCTVTEATWGSDGRTYDGTDDSIAIASSATLQPANGLIMLWIKPLTNLNNTKYFYRTTVDECSITRTNLTSDYNFFYDGSLVCTVSASSGVGVWLCLGFAFTQNATGYGYENGLNVTSGTCSATAPTAGTTVIGDACRGVIGEIVKYSGTYTQAESDAIMKRYYQLTKWRYI